MEEDFDTIPIKAKSTLDKSEKQRFQWTKHPDLEIKVLNLIKTDEFLNAINAKSVSSKTWDQLYLKLLQDIDSSSSATAATDSLKASLNPATIKAFYRGLKKSFQDFKAGKSTKKPRHFDLLDTILGDLNPAQAVKCTTMAEAIKPSASNSNPDLKSPLRKPAIFHTSNSPILSSVKKVAMPLNVLNPNNPNEDTPIARSAVGVPSEVFQARKNQPLFVDPSKIPFYMNAAQATPVLTQFKTISPKKSSRECLICTSHFPLEGIESHYDKCLDSLISESNDSLLSIITTCQFCNLNLEKDIPPLKLVHLKSCILNRVGSLEKLISYVHGIRLYNLPDTPAIDAMEVIELKKPVIPKAFDFLKPAPKNPKKSKKKANAAPANILDVTDESGVTASRTTALLNSIESQQKANPTFEPIFKQSIRVLDEALESVAQEKLLWEMGNGSGQIRKQIEIVSILEPSVASPIKRKHDDCQLDLAEVSKVVTNDQENDSVDPVIGLDADSADCSRNEADDSASSSDESPKRRKCLAFDTTLNDSVDIEVLEDINPFASLQSHRPPSQSQQIQVSFPLLSTTSHQSSSKIQITESFSAHYQPDVPKKKLSFSGLDSVDFPPLPKPALQYSIVTCIDYFAIPDELVSVETQTDSIHQREMGISTNPIEAGIDIEIQTVTQTTEHANNAEPINYDVVSVNDEVEPVNDEIEPLNCDVDPANDEVDPVNVQDDVDELDPSLPIDLGFGEINEIQESSPIPVSNISLGKSVHFEDIHSSILQVSEEESEAEYDFESLQDVSEIKPFPAENNQDDALLNSEDDLFTPADNSFTQELYDTNIPISQDLTTHEIIDDDILILSGHRLGQLPGNGEQCQDESQNGSFVEDESSNGYDSDILPELPAPEDKSISILSQISVTSTIIDATQRPDAGPSTGLLSKLKSPDPKLVMMPDYSSMRLHELKQIADQNGLKVKGKTTLITKLTEVWTLAHGENSISHNAESRLKEAIQQDEELYEKILCFDPIDFDQCFTSLSAHQNLYGVSRKVLQSYFDKQGINYKM